MTREERIRQLKKVKYVDNEDLLKQLVELLKMDEHKLEMFNKMMDRTEALTSDYGFDIEKTWWNKPNKDGRTRDQYLIYELRGTRSSMRITVDVNVGDDEPLKIVRKPRGLVKYEYLVHYLHTNGENVWTLMK